MLDLNSKIYLLIKFLNKIKIKDFSLFILFFNLFFLCFFYILQTNSLSLWMNTILVMFFIFSMSLFLFFITLNLLIFYKKNIYFKKYKSISIFNLIQIYQVYKKRIYIYDRILLLYLFSFNLLFYLLLVYFFLTI